MNRALLSVSDKRGIVEFAKALVDKKYEILSTGGTYNVLKEAGVDVVKVEDFTGAKEIFEGRVKTLHPKIHGGILGRRSNESDMEQAKNNDIKWIDMVVVNLYPFKQTLENKSSTHSDKIENIDIGGPTMIRSAAKNYNDVMVVCDPNDYELVIRAISNNSNDLKFREMLAGKAFSHTAHYDALISSYFNKRNNIKFPETITKTWQRQNELRYGENPHQNAAAYVNPLDNGSYNLFNAIQHSGKELSYNNYNDANSALEIVMEFKQPTVVALKHTNPCGVASAETIDEAFIRARDCDPVSIFGGIIAANRVVNEKMAEEINKIFVEVVLAPSFTDKALDILTAKPNIRLLSWNEDKFYDGFEEDDKNSSDIRITSIKNGVLIQDADDMTYTDFEVVTSTKPTDEQIENLKFAWNVVKHVKSNAICISKDMQTIGVGVGQVNRIWSVEEAVDHSRYDVNGAVMASDGFFPFADSIEKAHSAGIKAIIQPGGSIRDEEVIAKADEYGIAMVFTRCRHFKH